MTLQLFCWADDYLLCCTSVLREFHWSVCDCGFYVMFKWAIPSCKTCKRLLPTPSSSNSCSTALAFFVPTEAGIFIYRKKLSKLVKGFLPCRVSYRDMTFRYCIGVYVQVRACVRACVRVCMYQVRHASSDIHPWILWFYSAAQRHANIMNAFRTRLKRVCLGVSTAASNTNNNSYVWWTHSP